MIARLAPAGLLTRPIHTPCTEQAVSEGESACARPQSYVYLWERSQTEDKDVNKRFTFLMKGEPLRYSLLQVRSKKLVLVEHK